MPDVPLQQTSVAACADLPSASHAGADPHPSARMTRSRGAASASGQVMEGPLLADRPRKRSRRAGSGTDQATVPDQAAAPAGSGQLMAAGAAVEGPGATSSPTAGASRRQAAGALGPEVQQGSAAPAAASAGKAQSLEGQASEWPSSQQGRLAMVHACHCAQLRCKPLCRQFIGNGGEDVSANGCCMHEAASGTNTRHFIQAATRLALSCVAL